MCWHCRGSGGERAATSWWSGQAEGSFATVVAVHQSLADYIDSVSHHHRFTTVTSRMKQGREHTQVQAKVFSIHLPSSMNHTDDHVDTALRAIETEMT